MDSDEIQLLRQLFEKLATRSNNDLLKSILAAALIVSEKESGEDLKDIAKELINRL